jgi:hypothetical protein
MAIRGDFYCYLASRGKGEFLGLTGFKSKLRKTLLSF